MRFAPISFGTLMLLPTNAFADDSSATLGTGGLVLQKTCKISLVLEGLYLSPTAIRISYRFRNLTNVDDATTIAFPMPAFPGGGSNSTSVLPDPASDNFMKFQTLADGQSVPSQIEQRAFLVTDGQPDEEITDRLKAMRISLVPTTEATEATISRLTNAQRK